MSFLHSQGYLLLTTDSAVDTVVGTGAEYNVAESAAQDKPWLMQVFRNGAEHVLSLVINVS